MSKLMDYFENIARTSLVMIAVLCILFFSGCMGTSKVAKTNTIYILPTLESDFYDAQRAGNEAFRSGNYSQALEYWLTYIQTNRDDFNTIYGIAQCYGHLGEAELAGKYLVETLKYYVYEIPIEQHERLFSNVLGDKVFQEYLDKAREHNDRLEKIRGEMAYITAPTKIRYWTAKPDDYDPEKEYTILLFLHGHGGSVLSSSRGWGWAEILNPKDIILVQPQAPYPWMIAQGRATSFSWGIVDQVEEDDDENQSWVLTRNYIMALSNELRNQHKVKAMYLSGFSQGGGETLSIGLRNQDSFDGLICFGGGLWFFDEDEELPANKGVPVLIVHGQSDTVVSYDLGLQAFERLHSYGYDVTMQSFDGAHTIPQEVFSKAIEWILGEK